MKYVRLGLEEEAVGGFGENGNNIFVPVQAVLQEVVRLFGRLEEYLTVCVDTNS